jgi:hypothetical protein
VKRRFAPSAEAFWRIFPFFWVIFEEFGHLLVDGIPHRDVRISLRKSRNERVIMKKVTKTVVLASLFALMATMAQADEFIRPPETYAPVWYTSFPYQRNINMLFPESPLGGPSDTYDVGIPGAVYEGYDDPSLMSSDYVVFGGSVEWYASVSGIWANGAIGIDNRTGETAETGTATFHIDDLDDGLPLKDFWLETLALNNDSASINAVLYDPSGNPANLLGGYAPTAYEGQQLADVEWQITPNPLYETLVLSWSVPAGDYALLSDAHIATECVPEPATVSLLATGLIGLLAYAWRKRR